MYLQTIDVIISKLKRKKMIQRGQYSNGQLFLLHKRDVKKQDSFENDEQGDHGDLDNFSFIFLTDKQRIHI